MQALLNWLGKILIPIFVEKLFSFLKRLIDKYLRRKKIKDDAKDSVKPLKDAKTKEEIDAATDSTLDGF